MGFQAKILTVLSIFVSLVTMSTWVLDGQFKLGLNHFNRNIFHNIWLSNVQENIIFSPFSTHTTLAMVRMGADGETAIEMDRTMGFTGQRADTIADNYFTLLSAFDNSDIVHLANKIYVMTRYELQDSYNKILNKKFQSTAESIDFTQNYKASEAINNWVESKTNQLIKDVISPNLLNSDTRLVLVNAIHFKGAWLDPFDPRHTRESEFFLDDHKSVKVQMMRMIKYFEYAEFDQFSTLRLPYKDTDLSMLIFVPFERTGLAKTLEELRDTSLDVITGRLRERMVEIDLPKFKIEFSIELNDSLKKLGMTRIFNNANFGKMLKSSEQLDITHFIHKAFIEVNESGTEASASTAAIAMGRSMPTYFTCDHPFSYVIVNAENVVLFQGNVVKF